MTESEPVGAFFFYDTDMLEDLDHLATRISQLAKHAKALEAERASLQAKLVAAERERDNLAAKLIGQGREASDLTSKVAAYESELEGFVQAATYQYAGTVRDSHP